MGGKSSYLPLQKGRERKQVLARLKGGGHTEFWVVLTQELEVLAILKEGRKRFPPFKGRGEFYHFLRRAQKVKTH